MIFYKNVLFQIDSSPTQNVASQPLLGLNTGFDGFYVCGTKPFRLGFSTSNQVAGVSGINTGLRYESNIIYSLNQNSLSQVSLCCTEAGANVSFVCFKIDN